MMEWAGQSVIIITVTGVEVAQGDTATFAVAPSPPTRGGFGGQDVPSLFQERFLWHSAPCSLLLLSLFAVQSQIPFSRASPVSQNSNITFAS